MASSRRRSVTSLSDILEVFTPQPPAAQSAVVAVAAAAIENERGVGDENKKPVEGTGAREFDDTLTRLVRHEVSGLLPFLVFLLAMPFLGVATHTASVAALGHGVKRAIGSVKIEGGRRVTYSSPPQPQQQEQQQQQEQEQRGLVNEEGEEEVVRGQGKEVVSGVPPSPVYGVEYTAYRLDVETIEVLPSAARGRVVVVDKGKRRAEV